MFCLYCLPLVLSCSNLKLHQTLEVKNIFKPENMLQLTFNPRLTLTGFRTTRPRGPCLEAPGNYRAPLSCFVFHSRGSFKRFENCTVKLSAKETKWTSSEVKTRPTFLETSILKSDSGPVKLPGLSRNGPLVIKPFVW